MNVSPLSNSIMSAAVFHGHERITIERVAMPEVAAGEVLVRISRTALCGSDFKLWHKGADFTAGHEIFGVVEQPAIVCMAAVAPSISRCIATAAPPARAATPRCASKFPA